MDLRRAATVGEILLVLVVSLLVGWILELLQIRHDTDAATGPAAASAVTAPKG